MKLAAGQRRILERHKGTDQHVALVIALLGWNGNATYTDGVGAICEATGLADSTVRRAIARIAKRGDLKREPVAEGGTKRRGWGGYGFRLVWQAPIAEERPGTEADSGARGKGKHAYSDSTPQASEFASLPGASSEPGKALRSTELADLPLDAAAASALCDAASAIDLAEEIVEAHGLARLQVHGIQTPSRLPAQSTIERLTSLARVLSRELELGQVEIARAMMLAYVELDTPWLREHGWPLAAVDRDLERIERGARARLRRRTVVKPSEAEVEQRLVADFERDRSRREAARRLREQAAPASERGAA